MSDVLIVGNARCYHTMDWYRRIRDHNKTGKTYFVTDLIESEGHKRIVAPDDGIIKLFIIDRWLIGGQSTNGNRYRNIVKALFIPIQAARLRMLIRKYPDAIVHAHTMYYVVLCWIARIKYMATPQGSEILRRVDSSVIYRYFAIRSLRSAQNITVDSYAMKEKIACMLDRDAEVIQNGINTRLALAFSASSDKRKGLVSMRGMTSLYQINKLLDARERYDKKLNITFLYPFWEESYRKGIQDRLMGGDVELGRVSQDKMYSILSTAQLAVSIPLSDSSPRSVYEAIFCGCCVAVTDLAWIRMLPECMRSRIYVVNLEDAMWLENALSYSATVVREPFRPSEEALALFDQEISMKRVVVDIYGLEKVGSYV